MPIRALFFVFLLGCVFFAFPGHAVELVEGPTVEAADSSATIRWKTDVECGTRLRYGPSEDKLENRAGDGVSVSHVVTLTGLTPDTAYAYSVGTAKMVLKTDFFLTKKPGELKAVPPVASSTASPNRGASAPPKTDSSQTPSVPEKDKGFFAKLKEALTGRKGAPPGASTQSQPLATKRSAPPTSQTWGSMRTLQDHFDRHGADFHATSPDDYARQAWEFLQRANDEGFPAKVDDEDGTLRVFDPKTRAFAAYNRDGTTKTYFKPGSPDYFGRQPGRSIKLKRSE